MNISGLLIRFLRSFFQKTKVIYLKEKDLEISLCVALLMKDVKQKKNVSILCPFLFLACLIDPSEFRKLELRLFWVLI